MKIYKNLLSEIESKQIEELLCSSNFPWYLNKIFHDEDISPKINLQMTHSFYQNDMFNSQFKEIVELVKDKINWFSLVRVKANLLFRTDNIIEHGMHCDYIAKNLKTAIYYVNTNNGYTKFKSGKKINSERNKFIEFNSREEHTGSTCTDNDTRIVINFNYIK